MQHVVATLACIVLHSHAKQQIIQATVSTTTGVLSSSLAYGVNVLDFGANGNDTSFDNTLAFNQAIEYVHSQGGGSVLIPAGQYNILGQIIIQENVNVVGSFMYVPSHSTRPTDGTVLLPNYMRGQTDTIHSFITFDGDNASLKGLCIFYEEQVCSDNEPIPFPPAILVNDSHNIGIFDIELVNPFIGIWLQHAGRHLVQNVMGQPIFLGIYMDDISSLGRIENVHFSTFFCNHNNKYKQFQMNHGVAFALGRADWETVLNAFAHSYAVGFHFFESEYGAFNGNLLSIGSDWTSNASVLIDASKACGIAITNSAFEAQTSSSSKYTLPVNILISNSSMTGTVMFDNCAFWGHPEHVAVLHGDSTTTFSNCLFRQWGQGNDEAAIYADNGIVMVTQSTFEEASLPQLHLAAGVKKAIMANNLLSGKLNVSIDGSVDFSIYGNL